MKRNYVLGGLLALWAGCADQPQSTQRIDELFSSCSTLGAADLTTDDSALRLAGDLVATVNCTSYDDPRIYGTVEELVAFLAESCTVGFGELNHAVACDTSAPPVIIDETADTVTISRCVDGCSGATYTAEGGTWAEVPDVDVFDYSCETSGDYAGCCDFFNVAPDQLGSCDRYWRFDELSSTWVIAAVGGEPLTTTTGTLTLLDTSTTTLLARARPTTFPEVNVAVAPTMAAAGADPVPPGTTPPDPRRAELMKRIAALIAAIAFGGVPYHTELGEQLQKIAEQARDLAENKGQQRQQIEVMPRPVARGPLDPSPPKKGIIVMPGGRPGTSRPIDRPPGIDPVRPGLPPGPARPPVEPPKPPRPPGIP